MDWLWRGIRHCYFKMHCGSRTDVSNLKFKGKTTRYLLVLQVVHGQHRLPEFKFQGQIFKVARQATAWIDEKSFLRNDSTKVTPILVSNYFIWIFCIYIYFFTEIGNLTSFLLRTEYLRAKKLLSINAQYNYLLIEKFKIWIDCN